MTKEKAAEIFLRRLKAKYPLLTQDAIVRGNTVYWESGPYEWSIDIDYALFEEAAPGIAEFSGKPAKFTRPKTPTLDELTPKGFYHEAVNGSSIAMYPA